MKKRKLVVVLLALIMALSAFVTSASAASIPSISPDTSTTSISPELCEQNYEVGPNPDPSYEAGPNDKPTYEVGPNSDNSIYTNIYNTVAVPSIIPDSGTPSIPNINPGSGAAIPSIVPDSNIPNVPSIVPQPSDYIVRTLNVSVDGVLVPDVYVYQDIYGFFRLYSAEALKKIFPRELNQASISFNANDGIVIDTYIQYFGYTADVYNNTLRIYTHRSNAVQLFYVYTNGLYTGTTNDPKSLKVPTNGKVIYSGNRIYINNDGNSPVEIYVKGNLVRFPDQQPFIASNRTMVPIRAVAEMLDCKVDWSSEFNCAIITRGSHTVNIFPGKTGYLVDGKYYDMDVVPIIVGDRTMVPIRFVAEALGLKVGFNSGTIPTVTLD